MANEQHNLSNLNSSPLIDRRKFLVNASLGIAGASLLSHGAGAVTEMLGQPRMPIIKGKRLLGSLEVSSISLGCMSMAGVYNTSPPKQDMLALIRKAVDLGETFFDTAEVYDPHLSEEIVGEALAPFRGKVVIASKFGFETENGQRGGLNSRSEHIRQAIEGSLKRLRVETIDLYYLHRLDPNVPIEDVAGTVKELIKQGKVKHFGLSEVAPATIRRAHAVQTVSALQSEYSLFERAVENQILSTCEELGIGFVPWGPVARGYLTGRFDENSTFAALNRRGSVALFKPEALKNNTPLLALVKDWAKRKECTPAQFSLGWLLSQKPFIVPIPGTINPKHLEENLGGENVKLTSDELSQIKDSLDKIQLQGARKPESALRDQ